jgi:uncharacterized protein (TIGR01244 family)
MRIRMTALAAALATAATAGLVAQTGVTKENIPGITNFARLETTVACAGATKADSVPEIKKMGFAAIINVREANEPGAEVDKEEAAAKTVGLRFVHIPFNLNAPAPDLVDRFLATIRKPENNPAFIHCAGGGRAASLWTIKRMMIDGWDQQRALEEGTALGLTARLQPFVLDYVQTHKR